MHLGVQNAYKALKKHSAHRTSRNACHTIFMHGKSLASKILDPKPQGQQV
jgi:hypothetical protein